MKATRRLRLGTTALLLVAAACGEERGDGELPGVSTASVVGAATDDDDPVMDAVLAWVAKASVSGACHQIVVDIKDCACSCGPQGGCQCVSEPSYTREEACVWYAPWTGTKTNRCREEKLSAVSLNLQQCRAAPACATRSPLLSTAGPGPIEVGAGGSVTLGAMGGHGAYSWVVTTNNSGGTVSADGVYTAGPLGGTDTVTITDTTGARITVQVRSSTAKSLVVLAGVPSGSGTADGVGAGARFSMPLGVAVDAAGNAYVADHANHTIRKIAPAATAPDGGMTSGIVTTFAGTPGACGNADGAGATARFCGPVGLVADAAGTLYVADRDNHTIRKITSGGVVTTIAGAPGQRGAVDGIGAAARFNSPLDLTIDARGNLYVVDSQNYAIRRVSPSGSVETVAGRLGETGRTDTVTAGRAGTRFSNPIAITINASGDTLFVVDDGCTIRAVATDRWSVQAQWWYVTTIVGAWAGGNVDAAGTAARFKGMAGIAYDPAGGLYVTDAPNKTVRKVALAGLQVTTVAGAAGEAGDVDGPPGVARFGSPSRVTVDGRGSLYVTDSTNHALRRVTQGGVVTSVAGRPGIRGSVDGTGPAARFYWPRSPAVDGAGNVFVADYFNHTVRKVTPAGVTTTVAGAAGQSGRSDGSAAEARFSWPEGVAVNAAGHVYVADTGGCTIRKVTPDGVVTTLAGDGRAEPGVDGVGPAARFSYPRGLAVDGTGNIYVADTGAHTIRRVTPGGAVTTIAGAPRSPGAADGVGAAARFDGPAGVAVDGEGNVFVADERNHTIRKINPAGAVVTFAGVAGEPGAADGVGRVARFRSPSGVAVDRAGNVYVADRGNHAIRRITRAAEVATVVGHASPVTLGNFTGALPGSLADPVGVAVGPHGELYIAVDNGVLVANLPLFVTVNGGGSLTVEAGVPVQLGASGGSGGYTWSLVVNQTGGTVSPDGVYTAGELGGSDTLIITDASGNTTAVTITSTTTTAAVARGFDFLIAQRQRPDGGFGGGYRETERLYTSEVALALEAWQRRGSPYQAALSWLESHPSRNADDAARRIMVLGPIGGSTAADVAAIRAAQSPRAGGWGNGGVGLTGAYVGDALDTALALEAYHLAAPGEATAPLLDYLTGSQLGGGAGGWAVGVNAVADPTTTAHALLALAPRASADPGLAQRIANALDALEDGSNSWSSAEAALVALASLRHAPASARSARLRHQLIARQASDGSWDEDVYATALALRALAEAKGRGAPEWDLPVAVPDAALRAALNKALGRNALDGLNRGELAQLTRLDISGKPVRDLTGLEHAINLTLLDARGAPVASFDPVAVRTGLTVLR